MRFRQRLLIGFVIGCLAQAAMLRSAERPRAFADDGTWQVRALNDGKPGVACFPDRAHLLRIGMPARTCVQRLIASSASEWQLEYACPSIGSGRSTFHRLDKETIRITTQGVARGQPYAVDYEAKRQNRCM